MPSTMLAMVLRKPGTPLVLRNVPMPVAGPGQVLVKIIACGVCRTDLHILDGELPHPKLPLIPGHEIIGTVVSGGDHLAPGTIVGIPWLGYTCGHCKYCHNGKENLCSNAGFTGYTINGGYATYTVAWEKYCFALPARYANETGAPLLCAGLIGYRTYRMIDPHAVNIGIYGFGAAAHIIAQIAAHQGKSIYAFTRPNDLSAQRLSQETGAIWSGGSDTDLPIKLDAAMIFAADGRLVIKALRDVDKGGQVICGGIHMSDIPSFPYRLLWEERILKSVANLTREDGDLLFNIAQAVPVRTTTQLFELHQANEALERLRNGQITGAAVLVMSPDL